MMLFKLSFKNIRKSIKDYAIFFFTLVIGIAIFYVFNAIEKQTVMINTLKAQYDVVTMMNRILSGVSVFVSIVLGLLIVYASNFLIKRRKKEFGTYMILGMKKRNIATIMFGETIIIGVFSLIVGLIIGVIVSQGMSILVANLFEVDMTKFKFIISIKAIEKTILYFAIIYVIVIIFDMFVVSKAKLINLLTASKKAEKRTNKNIVLCIIVFIISAVVLATAYYKMVYDLNSLENEADVFMQIGKGIAGTFTFFWSLSGIIVFIATRCKKFYYKGINSFSTKEISTKINSNICSASVICLMMFFTICMLSSGFAIRNSMNENMRKKVNQDIVMNYDIKDYVYTKSDDINTDQELEELVEQNKKEFCSNSVKKTMDDANMSELIDIKADVWLYTIDNIKAIDFAKNVTENELEYLKKLSGVFGKEKFIHLSDYNKIAQIYGTTQYSLNENEYIVVCDRSNVISYREIYLKKKQPVTLNNKEYIPKYDKCMDGYLEMSENNMNSGVVVVPDSVVFDDDNRVENVVIGSYNSNYNYPDKYDTVEEYVDNELKDILSNNQEKKCFVNIATKSKIRIISAGLKAMVVFIVIYIGIIFMISSAAVLSLKSLSDATDNAHKYLILRRIGVSEKMIHKSLFSQSLIFFGMPVILAIIHSIFGIKFSRIMILSMGFECKIDSIIAGVLVMLIIYLIYFLITYFTSRKIIDEKK